jgi:hypothetical protein
VKAIGICSVTERVDEGVVHVFEPFCSASAAFACSVSGMLLSSRRFQRKKMDRETPSCKQNTSKLVSIIFNHTRQSTHRLVSPQSTIAKPKDTKAVKYGLRERLPDSSGRGNGRLNNFVQEHILVRT